jgi:hypothetical protein
MATTETSKQKKDVMLTIPIEQRHDPLTKIAARRSGTSVAAWIRLLMLKDLQEKGLVDQDFNEIQQTEVA